MDDEADTKAVADKAGAAVGAGPQDNDETSSGQAPNPPPPPSNEPPPKQQTPEEKAAADKAAADKAAADKAAADAAAAENKPLDKSVWGTTNDEVGDSVLTLLQNSGLTVDEAKAMMFDAVQAGDVTKLDRAALAEKVGKEKATLILAGAENFITRSAAKAATIVKEVHNTVGGEANWSAITGWATKNVAEGDLATYRSMIDAGGAQARFAASELKALYNADSKNTTLGAANAELKGDSGSPQQGRQLTKAQYVAELEAAHRGNPSPAVINEINAARARGRAAGI
jgi:hypothetical protein